MCVESGCAQVEREWLEAGGDQVGSRTCISISEGGRGRQARWTLSDLR